MARLMVSNVASLMRSNAASSIRKFAQRMPSSSFKTLQVALLVDVMAAADKDGMSPHARQRV